MQQTEQPPRLFSISSIITAHEAALFDRFIEIESRKTSIRNFAVEEIVAKITSTAKQVFGQNASSEICGSFAKGTETANSDIDLYIDTDYPVSRDQQLEFVDKLKKSLHNENINMGRLAIHANTMCCDFDIVCSNTVDYGIRPRPNEKIGNSRTVQYTARGLKVMVASTLPRKLSGYIIEDMVDAILTAYPLVPPVYGSGGLQHLLSVLQCIIDCEQYGDKIFALKGGTGQTKLLQRMSKQAIHHFLMSHPIRGGLHTIAEICLWLTLRGDSNVDTKAGKVFNWLALRGGTIPDNTIHSSVYHRYAPSIDPKYVSPSASIENHHLVIFASDPSYAPYLLKEGFGQKTPLTTQSTALQTSTIGNLAYLSQCALQGSRVAQRMVCVRNMWNKGMQLISQGTLSKEAINTLANAVRGSTRDSDSFSGMFDSSSEHNNTLRRNLEVCKASTNPMDKADACFVDALFSMSMHNFQDAIRLMKEGLKWYPTDAYGLLFNCAMLHGCINEHTTQLKYILQCAEIEPDEPMFYYWKGICRKQKPPSSLSKVQMKQYLEETIQCFQHYVDSGYSEGRKFSQAYYEMAFLQSAILSIDGHSPTSKTFKDSIEKFVRLGQSAERLTVPYFAPLKCDSKRDALSMVDLAGQTNGEQLQTQANTYFKQNRFFEAIELYSQILEDDANNVKILTNRSFACSQVGLYSAAIEDAEKAIMIDPSWVKGYFRMAVGYIGNAQLDIAKKILHQGITRCTVGSTASPPAEFTNLLNEIDTMCLVPAAAPAHVVDGTFPFRLEDLPCHTKIKYPDAWFLIDPTGNRGHYVSVTNAVNVLQREKKLKHFTLILLPGKHYDQINLLYLPSALNIQLIGWFPLSDDVKRNSVIHGYSQECAPPGRRRYIHPDYLLIQVGHHLVIEDHQSHHLDIEDISFRQPVGAPNTNVGSCLFCADGVMVTAKHCKFDTPNSPCFMIRDKGTEVTLDHCVFNKVSAGLVIGHEGKAIVNHCTFRHCSKMAVEIRSGGRATISHCSFDEITMQAIVLYQKGHSVTVTQCAFKHCGNHSELATVAVETGTVILRDCHFKEIPGDGVVVQASPQGTSKETDPVVYIQDCDFHKGRSGIVLHYGSGLLLNNKIRVMSMYAIYARNLVTDKKLTIRGNQCARNSMGDILICGETMFRANVAYEQATGSAIMQVAPDSMVNAIMSNMQRELHSIGAQ